MANFEFTRKAHLACGASVEVTVKIDNLTNLVGEPVSTLTECTFQSIESINKEALDFLDNLFNETPLFLFDTHLKEIKFQPQQLIFENGHHMRNPYSSVSTDAACSAEVEDAESTSSPMCPGWPPAEPKQHGWPSHSIGVPWGVTRDSEGES